MDAVVSKAKAVYRREWQNERAREANMVSSHLVGALISSRDKIFGC